MSSQVEETVPLYKERCRRLAVFRRLLRQRGVTSLQWYSAMRVENGYIVRWSFAKIGYDMATGRFHCADSSAQRNPIYESEVQAVDWLVGKILKEEADNQRERHTPKLDIVLANL